MFALAEKPAFQVLFQALNCAILLQLHNFKKYFVIGNLKLAPSHIGESLLTSLLTLIFKEKLSLRTANFLGSKSTNVQIHSL